MLHKRACIPTQALQVAKHLGQKMFRSDEFVVRLLKDAIVVTGRIQTSRDEEIGVEKDSHARLVQ